MRYHALGTVLQLRGQAGKVMIYGRKQVHAGRVYDYIACPYPEGLVRPDRVCLFDHDCIEAVYFEGYQCPAETEYERRIQAFDSQRGVQRT